MFNGEGRAFQQIGLKQPPTCGGTKPTLILASQYTKLILRRIRTFHVKDKAVKLIGGKKKPGGHFPLFFLEDFIKVFVEQYLDSRSGCQGASDVLWELAGVWQASLASHVP